jgi:hypothetical protein
VAKEGVTVVKSIGFKDQVKNILSATNDVASEGMLICSEKILVYYMVFDSYGCAIWYYYFYEY